MEHGYGHTPDQVETITVDSAEVLYAYYDAPCTSGPSGMWPPSPMPTLPRIVDTSWDPPVTLAVRLVSVIDDDLEHAGQAAYLRGMIEYG